ncbi:MAG: GIY-YIG nuclease family protein [Cyanobacteria bacterium]|nr:GIY-YIG nuclease family protein [Cyanobacteriota bacterium]
MTYPLFDSAADTNIEQGKLFSAKDLAGTYHVHQPQHHTNTTIDQDAIALNQWKQRVRAYQQTHHQPATPSTQGSLFDLPNASPSGMSEKLVVDPFQLPRQNTQFWRWNTQDAGVSALYFVIDYDCSLVLYVGETIKSESRWKGVHDCKRYLLHYQQAHYNLDLTTQLGIAFWKDAPTNTRSRQRLESEMIYQWRSPFNKENWTFWGTPFVQDG